MDKYLSIITNFGCHYTCPYCIVKENNLHIPKTTINGLKCLNSFAKFHQCNWISISGGGDPLHNLAEHLEWYDELQYATNGKYKLELHTSYILNHDIYKMFDRVVYHIRSTSDIELIERYGNQKVRVVFVVDESFNKYKIELIVRKIKENTDIDELSFRQMVDSNYETTHYCEEYLQEGHMDRWYYITQGDYNLYYVENQVYDRYEDFKIREEEELW